MSAYTWSKQTCLSNKLSPQSHTTRYRYRRKLSFWWQNCYRYTVSRHEDLLHLTISGTLTSDAGTYVCGDLLSPTSICSAVLGVLGTASTQHNASNACNATPLRTFWRRRREKTTRAGTERTQSTRMTQGKYARNYATRIRNKRKKNTRRMQLTEATQRPKTLG